MKTQTIFRFAVLCTLFGVSAATTIPAFAQKDDRRGGTAKEDRTREEQNKNKESRSSGTSKSDKGSSTGRKERR